MQILKLSYSISPEHTSDWTDYVFKKDYPLMPLHDVAAYVKENSHLPGVPCADSVKAQGIDVATMDATLLKKIEELTLYAIQQQKEIDELKQELHELIKKQDKK